MSFDALATTDRIAATMDALQARGIRPELVSTGLQALERLRSLIPPGASVTTGASLTLKEIGFEDLLASGSHPWKNLKGEYLAEKDPARQMALRRQASLADYWLGSVHAVAQTGEVVIASMSGSQLAAYAYAASNLIWVIGAQKLTGSLDEAIRRVREYVLPHEDKRMRDMTGGKTGSMIGKLMVFEREAPFLKRNVTALIVQERLGD